MSWWMVGLEGVRLGVWIEKVREGRLYKNPRKVRPCSLIFRWGGNQTTITLIAATTLGKTSFIQFMLEQPFLGANISQEPSTDRFMAVMKV
jgi:hypothetical protein